jgi:poly-gamma-glutamate synthesis protein (capsule biosynthesis protein)
LFLCGDVMTGRGVDQIPPCPSNPRLFEPYVLSARTHVELAEKAHGPIAQPVSYAYIWGNAIDEIGCQRPDARNINLESAVTTYADAWQNEGIHYRMQPANVACGRVCQRRWRIGTLASTPRKPRCDPSSCTQNGLIVQAE